VAGNIKNAPVGAAVVSLGPWVPDGAAGTLVDVGYLKEGVELHDQSEDYELETENTQSPVRSIPYKKTVTLKVVMAENDFDKLAKLLRQPAGNLTGTAPNKSLAVDMDTEQYFQLQVVTVGVAGTNGTFGTRTITLYKCVPKTRDAIKFQKKGEQVVGVTFNVLQDASIAAGSGQFYKAVDTEAA
jgi:hypothetical protein